MIGRSLSIAACAVLLATAAVSSANAGSPCCCAAPCGYAVPVVVAPPVVVYEPYVMYVVDQGPVYSGPGIYTNPTLVVPRPMARYPYVGRDYRYLPPYREPLRSRY